MLLRAAACSLTGNVESGSVHVGFTSFYTVNATSHFQNTKESFLVLNICLLLAIFEFIFVFFKIALLHDLKQTHCAAC